MKKLTAAYLSFIFSIFFGYMASENLSFPFQQPQQQTVLISGLAKNQTPTETEITPDILTALRIAAASEAAKQREASSSAIQPIPTLIKSDPTITVASTETPILTPTEVPAVTPTPSKLGPTSTPKSSATVINDPGSAVIFPQQNSSAQVNESAVTAN